MDFAGGCGGTARDRESALGAGREKRQCGSERASAPASVGVGGRVGAGAGRLRRVAASTNTGSDGFRRSPSSRTSTMSLDAGVKEQVSAGKKEATSVDERSLLVLVIE